MLGKSTIVKSVYSLFLIKESYDAALSLSADKICLIKLTRAEKINNRQEARLRKV